MKEFDIISIGGGSGGIATMNRAGEYGASAAVIEEKQLGGTCVNRGCVPIKIMWYGAQIAEAIRDYGPATTRPRPTCSASRPCCAAAWWI